MRKKQIREKTRQGKTCQAPPGLSSDILTGAMAGMFSAVLSNALSGTRLHGATAARSGHASARTAQLTSTVEYHPTCLSNSDLVEKSYFASLFLRRERGRRSRKEGSRELYILA